MIPGITAQGVRVGGGGGEDPFFANVVSLIHWDGADASTTYVDQIPGRTWTNGSNGGALTTAEKMFGSASLKFPGTANNQVNSDTHADFTFGTGDWTIEWWFRTPSAAGTIMLWDQRISGGASNRPCIFQQSGNILYYTGVTRISAASPLLANTWQHWAVSKNSGSTRLFCHGIQQGSTFADTIDYQSSRVRLGTNGDTAGGFGTNSGWYDDIRVTKGVGRYTANFTPPAAPFPNS